MSGHSKWNNIKRKKEKTDGAKAKVFTKIGREISVAVRDGGPNPASNSKLADLIAKAKRMSVPNDNIQRIIKKAEGGDKTEYEAITYEGYGPGGVAVLIECLTDNRNRSASDVKVAVTRNGGTMADVGSVSRIFDRKGIVEVAKSQGGKNVEEDDLLEATLDADPEDVSDEGETLRVISDPSVVVDVRKAVQSAGYDYESAEVQFVPQYTTAIDAKEAAEKLFRLLDAIEDVDDVQTVYSNEDVPEAVLAELE